jgi:2-polyprenyl-3-methyl-5-hydroxy-6-metoxy-1,4-benzoquinol methylase
MGCSSGCCGGPPDTSATGRFFGKEAARYGRSFERKGPDPAQRTMLRLLKAAGVSGAELLDIGCGVGPLHLTLLQQGAGSAVGVDIAAPMLGEAARLAGKLGVADRVTYHTGDFVALAGALPAADATMLDKVVCCYEDVDAIVDSCTAKAHHLLALSYPRDNWLVRRIAGFIIGFTKLFSRGFHPFIHDWQRMGRRIEAHGFALAQSEHTAAWQVQLYRRRDAAPTPN